jgi:hypothetical protein
VYLDAAYLPKFKTKSKEERIKYLKFNGVKDNLDDVSLKDLDKMVYKQAMISQLTNTNER